MIDQFYAIGDKNLNGSLSKDEFQAVAKELGYFDIINMYWAYMDANNDGLVTKAEMIAFTESTYQQNALFSSFNATRKEKETTKIENYFRKYDTDKNNQLSRTEIASIPKSNDPLYKQFLYNGLFNDLDTNKDSELS